MKHLLTVMLAMLMLAGAYAQKHTIVEKSLRDYSVMLERTAPSDGSEAVQAEFIPYKSTMFDEDIIGETFYDKQSNRAVANRIYLYDDGTMAATWTRSMESGGFTDRGAGYNYFDGSEWGDWPTERIETMKCGWPSYAPLGENGEIVVSHNAVDALIINRRSEKGTGDWTESILQGPPGYEKVTWPRVVTTGADNGIVHVLGQIRNGYEGQEIALAYYRSSDGGDSWDISNEVLEGVGPDYYTEVGADAQVWAEPRNGILAFAVFNMWQDMFIYKSMDDGDTWEKTIVWEHPYPFYNDETIFTDTLWCPDNSGHIAIDNEGKVHVVFGIAFISHFESGTTYSYWPGLSNGIGYWNEDMPAFEAADQHDALDPYDVLQEDVNLIGWSQDLDGSGELEFVDIIAYSEIGLCTMPNITIDDNNQIFVVYAATTEGYDNGLYNYKHVWARTSLDGGTLWSEQHYDLTEGLVHVFDECVYPQLTPKTTDNIFLMYNVDATPGCAVDDDHPYEQNREFFVTVPKDDILGMKENPVLTLDQVSQNYPNPCSNQTLIRVTVDQKVELSLEITNLLGQLVYRSDVKNAAPGLHHFNVDVSNFDKGIYIYSVIADNQKINRKMMVE